MKPKLFSDYTDQQLRGVREQLKDNIRRARKGWLTHHAPVFATQLKAIENEIESRKIFA